MQQHNSTPSNRYNNGSKDTDYQGEREGIEVNIPDGSSLNSTEQDSPAFPSEVYQNLPEPLKQTCRKVLQDDTERETFLIGAIGVNSGLLPNVCGHYDGSTVYPNLYVYTVAPYGAGKGGLKYARELGKPIHQAKREEAERALAEYKVELAEYKAGNRTDEPQKPSNWMMFIPANNSKSGITELLDQNRGSGILFETEGDTLADALESKHGNFSDVLRKAFHHEVLSFFRRTGSEYRDIEEPKLSVVLSSTFDQFIKLIPTIENGLFSRFLYYQLTPTSGFRNVFDNNKRNYAKHFSGLGERFKVLYDNLSALSDPIEFQLTTKQKAHFLTLFDEWKTELGEIVGADLDGMVNRLGLITFRVAMQFSALRLMETGALPEQIICTDQDFENSLRIVKALKRNSISIYYKLPRHHISREADELEKELIAKAEKVALAKRYRREGKSYAEVAKFILGDAAKKGTIFKWLNK